MKEIEKIELVYDFLSDSREFALTESRPVRAVVDGEWYEGTARAILRIQPRPAIVFHGELAGVSAAGVMKTAIMMPDSLSEFEFNGNRIEGYSGGIWGSVNAKTNPFAWYPSSIPVIGKGDDSTPMSRVDFHLFNFRDIQTPGKGGVERRGNAGRAIHQVTLLSSQIRVTIVSLYETADQVRKLRAEGGACLTHVGRIERLDESEFTAKNAQQYLHELANFVSFAIGMQCLPVCACGFDASGTRLWEAWSEPSPEFGQRQSWFHHGRSDQVEGAFPCYMKTIEQDIWSNTIHAAIYWYLKANDDSRGIDAGVILAQAAFERLAFTYLVLDKGILSSKQFGKNTAAGNFRKLFQQLGIPTALPNGCVQLRHTIAMKEFSEKWADLPKAITSVRNFLVHPKTKSEHYYYDAMFDTWRASMWCLELAILGVIGYKGQYWNRIEGRVETVPWVSDPTISSRPASVGVPNMR